MKRAGLRVASVSHDTKLDAGRNARKPTKTGMFYDPLLGVRALFILCFHI